MKSVATTLAAVLTLLAATANAQPGQVTLTTDGYRQTNVQVSDLNLTNPQGVAVFKHRVRAAAERVCGPGPGVAELGRVAAYQSCLHRSVEAAMNSLITHEADANSAPDRR